MKLIKGGSVARLNVLRMNAMEWNRPRPPSMARDWRAMRTSTFRDAGEWAPSRDPIAADEIAPRAIKHTGWFFDDFQEDTARGYVAQLTHGRFVAGLKNSMSDWFDWDKSEVFTNEFEAAIRADENARIYAERENEYREEENAKIAAAEALQEKRDELDARIVELRDVIELHRTYLFARLCAKNVDYQAKQTRKAAQVRELAHGIIESIRTLRDEVES